MRKNGALYSMLFKPIGQIVLFKGLVQVVKRGLPLDKALERVPQIDWNIKSRIWENIIVTPDGRMIGRTEAYTLAEDLIAYLLAPEKMSEEGKEKLKVNYNKARGYNYVYPDGREAEELPLAVKAPAAA